jgi:nucleoside-diphosphate-sugar epimerase
VASPIVLITGGTGFVGSHVAERLVQCGFSVRALVRPGSDKRRLEELGAELAPGAVDQIETLHRAVAGVDVVVHLAALTHARSVAAYHRVNEAGTRDLVQAVLDADPRPRRFVYLSSLAAVGPSLDGRPVGPDAEPRPLTTYGRSKLAGERACLAAAATLEIAILRAPAVYGPRDRELFRIFRMARMGLMPLPAGSARRLQLVHVGDLADAVVAAAAGPGASGVFHIADPREYMWEQVVDLVSEAVGRRTRTFQVPSAVLFAAAALSEAAGRLTGRSTIFNREKVRELLAPAWLCETETARRELGFEAQIPLPRGLMETARWYSENGWL